MQNTERAREVRWTRHPCSYLVSKGSVRTSERERESEAERGKEREEEEKTLGAGPTRCSSSQLHFREVTMASDKQSTIDHFSQSWSPALEAAEGRTERGKERGSTIYAPAWAILQHSIL
jgi:hypothetical protein